jgi:hypothetical protein
VRLPLILAGLLASAGAAFAGGVVEGNGNLETRQENVRGFTEIDIGSGIGLEVVQGDASAVSIKAESNVLPRIQVEKQGTLLRIYTEPGLTLRTRGMLAKVIMPRLEKLTAHGGSQVSLAFDIPKSRFSGSVSGGARIRGTLAADQVRLEVSGGGSVTLEGMCSALGLSGSGGSVFHLSAFHSSEAAVELSGASRESIRDR